VDLGFVAEGIRSVLRQAELKVHDRGTVHRHLVRAATAAATRRAALVREDAALPAIQRDHGGRPVLVGHRERDGVGARGREHIEAGDGSRRVVHDARDRDTAHGPHRGVRIAAVVVKLATNHTVSPIAKVAPLSGSRMTTDGA
jgi:hypothetical protein